MTYTERAMRTLAASDVRRFWAKVAPDPRGECLLWTGATSKGGPTKNPYPALWLPLRDRADGEPEGVVVRAHRLAVRIVRGFDPGSLQANHTCYVSTCVNAYHLGGLDESEHARESNRARWRPDESPAQACATWPEPW